MSDFHVIPFNRDAVPVEVGIFARKVTLKVGAGFCYLTPDEAESRAAELVEAAGKARGAQLAGGAP